MIVGQGPSVDNPSSAAGIAFYRAYAITFRAGLPIECLVSVASGTDIQTCPLADIAFLGHPERSVGNFFESVFHVSSPHFTCFGGDRNSRGAFTSPESRPRQYGNREDHFVFYFLLLMIQ